MAKGKDRARNVRVGTSFTEVEVKEIDKYCHKLNLSRSEFVSRCVCVSMESDISLKVVANVISPTINGVKQCIKAMRVDNPEFRV